MQLRQVQRCGAVEGARLGVGVASSWRVFVQRRSPTAAGAAGEPYRGGELVARCPAAIEWRIVAAVPGEVFQALRCAPRSKSLRLQQIGNRGCRRAARNACARAARLNEPILRELPQRPHEPSQMFVKRLHASLAPNAYNARGQIVVGPSRAFRGLFARRGRGRGGLATMSDSLFRGRILSPPRRKPRGPPRWDAPARARAGPDVQASTTPSSFVQ